MDLYDEVIEYLTRPSSGSRVFGRLAYIFSAVMGYVIQDFAVLIGILVGLNLLDFVIWKFKMKDGDFDEFVSKSIDEGMS